MKTTNIKVVIITVLISFMGIGCEKSEFNERQRAHVSETSNNEEMKRGWLLALADIIIRLTEGQYSRVTHGDLVTESCDGLGACAMGAAFQNKGWEEISSDPFTHDLASFSVGGILAITKDEEVIFGLEDGKCDPSFYIKLFGGSEVDLSRTLVIDNPVILNRFGLRTPVVFPDGVYEIKRNDGLTYISVDLQ